MKIEQVPRIRGCRVFRDFRWPVDLPDFRQRNLIYGWNGTGKSTLSGVFRAIEKHQVLVAGEATVRIDGRMVSSPHFSEDSALPQVRVFDRAFVEENVFTTDSVVSPILVLGRESVEDQKRAVEIAGELEHRRRELSEAEKTKAARRSELGRFCSDRASGSVKIVLRSSGEGNPYSNYDKDDFERTCRQQLDKDPRERQQLVLSEAQEDECRKLLGAPARPPLAIPRIAVPDVAVLVQRAAAAMAETVVSRTIAELESDAALSSWVETGLELHRTRDGDVCLFCNQLLPESRLETLENHFNTEFRALSQKIAGLLDEVAGAIDALAGIALPKRAEVQDHLGDRYDAAVATFERERIATQALLQEVADALREKQGNPFAALPASFLTDSITVPHLEAVLEILAEHNATVSDFVTVVADARRRLEKSIVAASLGDYEAKAGEALDAENTVKSVTRAIVELETELAEIERRIVSHRGPAEELNTELVAYLGRDEIRFEIEGSGYAITRDGQPATHLSEGERTAIALLYFLKSLQHKDFGMTEGIVVIDDPVSSLDSNSMFCAFGYIKERTQSAGQLFVLTHNHAFFRLVKNWFGHLNRHKKKAARPAEFYLVECASRDGLRESKLGALDPLLADYESEYHYLFKKVFEAAEDRPDAKLGDYFWTPNVARRLLEGFLAFKQPGKTGLNAQLELIPFDTAKKNRIVRFLDTYSHNRQVGEADDDGLVLAESSAVLRDLLSLMEQTDETHYKQMVELVTRSTSGEGAAS